MHDLQRQDEPRPLSTRERVRAALAPVASSVVPGAGAAALYLATGTHWQVFKATLASWGIAPALGALLAPLVGIGAVAAIRYGLRQLDLGGRDDGNA